jgi:hypothetical protein
VDSLSGLRCVVCVEWFALKGQSGQLRVSQPDVYLLLQFLVSWLVCCMEFMGYGLPYFGGQVQSLVAKRVVSVFGEGGFHTSSALASTVLLGYL